MLVLVLVDLVLAGSSGACWVVGLVVLGEVSLSGVVLTFSAEALLVDAVFPDDLGVSFLAGCSSGRISGISGGIMEISSPVARRNFLFLRYLTTFSLYKIRPGTNFLKAKCFPPGLLWLIWLKTNCLTYI